MFTTHNHKSREGYYINHDLLMAVNEENKAKLITYHIAMNTPQKLDPEDRFKILNIMGKDRFYNSLGSFILTGISVVFMRNKNMMFLSAPFFFSTFSYCLHDNSEKSMLRSDLLSEMSIKYKFSTFDFHNSKKESQIGSLVSQIKHLPKSFENI